jgi:isoprenylcysteine carboxyl methyltransferase (ICMT) family protein YpbQ
VNLPFPISTHQGDAFRLVYSDVWGSVLAGAAVPARACPAALLPLAAGQVLRYAAIRTLGWRWSVKVIMVPGTPLYQEWYLPAYPPSQLPGHHF